MNGIITRDDINIENMIYEIRGMQVMLDSEISAIKCNEYIFDNTLRYWKTNISVYNFAETFCKI